MTKASIEEIQQQRIDIFLWHARFFKTRSISSQKIRSGKIRLNGTLIKKSSVFVRSGDMLTFAQEDHIRVIKILTLGHRRGPAPEAALLFEDHSPPVIKKGSKEDLLRATTAIREPGTGRPSKQERRALNKFLDDHS
jgi:ribosome-associated heat shock protein Hsp15